ncbi:hypothetical protein QJS83_16495 [Bdellovibrio sp. 22V]|uniref:hypothetical protein n=1 Tax=Bdellovibrio sp. 22V TaxID=3044166 RepID=UPI002543137E|nr:hypothetical protein [Bdellovibrio sp. 22V]WII72062.1 hypothetical protein QJS83_16495 [Bdellovibrio sp. 22V]
MVRLVLVLLLSYCMGACTLSAELLQQASQFKDVPDASSPDSSTVDVPAIVTREKGHLVALPRTRVYLTESVPGLTFAAKTLAMSKLGTSETSLQKLTQYSRGRLRGRGRAHAPH